ncbi:hypothetical protein Esti_000906 [Eimeria stiedai]
MDLVQNELDTSQYPMSTTHIGGQDATTRQIVIVNSGTLACASNSQLLLYKLETYRGSSDSGREGGDFRGSEESLLLAEPVSLHPPKSEGHSFAGGRGISAVAVDEDHEVIAVCGRSVGKPATIYIYSAQTFELLRQCTALGEQGFAVAAFRGKFNLGSEATAESKRYSKRTAASSGPAGPTVGERILAADAAEEHLEKTVDQQAAASQTRSLSSDVENDELEEGLITHEQLCNPEQAPLLAVIGWEGDGGEAASLGSQYLTLWNIGDGTAILRLKTPALQVMSLYWSPFFAYRLTASGSRHIRLWTAVRTFTGLKLKGHTCRFGHLTVSDVRSFTDLTEQMLISGSDWGNLLVWEDGSFKGEMLELRPDTAGLYQRGSALTRDQPKEAHVQRVAVEGLRTRTNPRGSVRVGRRGSCHIHQGPDKASERMDGSKTGPAHQQPKPCHQGNVSSIFRDPHDADKLVSAGSDGRIKWFVSVSSHRLVGLDSRNSVSLTCQKSRCVIFRWSVQAVLPAIQDMREDGRIAVPAISEFAMPDDLPIRSVTPNKYASGRRFWLVADGPGATWLFFPHLKQLVKVRASPLSPSYQLKTEMKYFTDVLTAGRDGSLRLWGPPPCRMPLQLRVWSNQITCVILNANLGRAESPLSVLAFDNGVVRLANVSSDGIQLLLAVKTHRCSITNMAIDPPGQHLAVLGEDGLLLFLKLGIGHRNTDAETETEFSGLPSTSELGCPAKLVKTASVSSTPSHVCWTAEPLGYVRTPEPLTRLIWELPLLLFGVACDAALLVVMGLEKLGLQTCVQSNKDSSSLKREGESEATVMTEDPHDEFSNVKEPPLTRGSIENSASDSEDERPPHGGTNSDKPFTQRCSEHPASKRAGRAKGLLDLTSLLTFRQENTLVSAVALRILIPDEDHASKEADLSSSDSEAEEATQLEPAAGALSGTLEDRGGASRGSLAGPTVTVHEMRRVLAAAMKQQRRRRAAAAALTAASARLTAITTGTLKASADTSLSTWWTPQEVRTSAASCDSSEDVVNGAPPFLIFSGTGNLRNAVWCAQLETFLGQSTEEPSACIGGDQIAVRPLVSLCKVLQQGGVKACGSAARCLKPFLTQIAVTCSDGLLVAGTSDGRMLLLLADAPDSCAVVRVFDSHTGLVMSACLTPREAPGRWALAAAAQSGEWWRCELDCHLLRRHLEKAKALECPKPEATAASVSAPTVDTQHATRRGPAQEHAEKQQQQQQLLRRLLMADSPAEDEHWCKPNENPDVMLSKAKKQKDMKAPCPEPVPLDELLQVVTMSRRPAESCLQSKYCDQTEDVLDPSEPTLVERHQVQQKQEAEAEADATTDEERLKLQQISQRYKARKRMRAITEEVQTKLMLHTSLSQANEAEADNMMKELDGQLQNAKRQHRTIISDIIQLFGGALDGVSVTAIFARFCVSSLPAPQIEIVPEDSIDPKAQADLLAIVEAARVQELKDLLVHEPSETPCIAKYDRSPTADLESLKGSKRQASPPVRSCLVPRSLAALSMQQPSCTHRSDANIWSEGRTKRVETMSALLHSRPPQDFTDPLDDAHMAQTLANLDAYRLTASGCLAEPTWNLGSSKWQQIRDLAQWASAKTHSFNSSLEVLSETRMELLNTSKRLLHGTLKAFQISALEDSPEYLQAKVLEKTVEDALMQARGKETFWSVDKQELVRYLEQRLDHLKNSGSLFETGADKAETAMVEAALAEARRLPQDFVIDFEHLRQPLADSNSEAAETSIDTRGPERTLLRRTPDASQPSESHTSGARLGLKEKLFGHIELLKQMEAHQSHMESRVITLCEAARLHPQTRIEERSRDSIQAQSTAWVEHEIMQIKLHGLKVLRIIEDSLNVFDGELRNLLRKRAVIQEQLTLAKLKHMEHHEELLVIKAMEPRTFKLQQDLLNERAEFQRISDCITNLEATIRATRACIENCHAHEKDIRQRLQEAIGPRHPQYGALIQIFECKVAGLTSIYPANSEFAKNRVDVANGTDGFGEEDFQHQDAEDMVVDVCPLGCDMVLYEALLELRDQKTANDSELARHQRELDELRKESAKLQSMHRQHLSRCKLAEAAVHKNMKELQGALNELETIVPLRASQIYCLSCEPEAWQLPTSLNSAILFSHEGFAALRQQVTELHQDVAVVGEDLRQLKRSFTAAKKDESQQSNQRLATLRSTFREVQLVRFGMSLTLEQVEAAAKVARRVEKQARAEPVKPAFERDVEAVVYKQAQLSRQQEQHDELQKRLKDLTKGHAALLRRFASSRGTDLLLSQQLRNKTSQQAATPSPQSSTDDHYPVARHHEEFAHLKEELEKRQAEIKSLQELIKQMQIKGGHSERAVLCTRDPHVSSPSLP